jgi:hypothetical protein
MFDPIWAAGGFVVGWGLHGLLDKAIAAAAIRILIQSVGKEQIKEALAQQQKGKTH